jgi:hypothetical protein
MKNSFINQRVSVRLPGSPQAFNGATQPHACIKFARKKPTGSSNKVAKVHVEMIQMTHWRSEHP